MATGSYFKKGSDAKCVLCADENKDTIADHYCHDCQTHLCKDCYRQDHRRCKDVKLINENARELCAEADLSAASAQLQSARENIEKARKVLDNDAASRQSNVSGFLTDLEATAEKLLCQIKELRENSLAKEINSEVESISSRDAVEGAVERSIQAAVERPGDSREERQSETRGDSPAERLDEERGNKSSNRSKTVRTIIVRISEDKDNCSMFGCCHLSDGCLVIADFNNKRLKRVDPSSGTITKHCDTDAQPCDVCWIGLQEVAVAFDTTQVHVYNAASLTRTRTLELNHVTTTIACHGGVLYCVSGLEDNTVYVYDVGSGRKLREIRPKNADGLDIFSSIYGIAVNGSGERLYLTDWNVGLVCVSTDGQVIFRLSQKDLGLSRATGVTTDHRGNVFVCGHHSLNVVMVTEDGHVVGQIMSKEDGIKSPECLNYDVSRRRLYVEGISDQLLMVEWKSSLKGLCD